MICTVVGARPNYIKMAPVIKELQRRKIPQILVHTGQHYDPNMSDIFFDQLGMPRPDQFLGVGSGNHADQTARIMIAFDAVCESYPMSLVVVAGDVNSTLACALVASKRNIPVAHVESGLRSFDRTMPEEINRVLTDHIADLLFTTEPSGNENLLNEGIDQSKIHYVGNSMIDSLRAHLKRAVALEPWNRLGQSEGQYGVVTLHRPSNVDNADAIRELVVIMNQVALETSLIFPIHPRTLAKGNRAWESLEGVQIVEPLGYLEFLGLIARAKFVITDSGGVQEETTALGVPCLTLRNNTERPITVTVGTNQLVKSNLNAVLNAVKALKSSQQSSFRVPDLWDGNAAIRIVDVLVTGQGIANV